MNKPFQQHISKLEYLQKNNYQPLLMQGLKGIEKESLRITNAGLISQQKHPSALGSALTNPYITTDYSEALLEFITPPFPDCKETLKFLDQIHQFVYNNLGEEMLLATSMPCGINGDDSIPIADYGSSNIGYMKHVYRQGLGHRYGRSMQTIAGVHFNYSVAEELWPILHQQTKLAKNLQHFIADGYFGLIRNFQCQGWILLYLFGASPAIDKHYFKNRQHLASQFDEFDKHTLYSPYATSLRMSDVGYQSKFQADLKIDYNSLVSYVDSLSSAIATPCTAYQKIGIKKGHKYRQLSANILQIENEFYNIIRPKQITFSGERPTLALRQRGVQYIEVRSLDLDPFHPTGFDAQTGHFLEAFLLNCLMQESPLQHEQEQHINAANQKAVAYQGRKPELKLDNNGQSVSLTGWARQILQSMQPICNILDQSSTGTPYQDALQQQFNRVENTDLTPSAKILAEMTKQQQSFTEFSLNISAKHHLFFKQKKLDAMQQHFFNGLVKNSHYQQEVIESTDKIPFDQFLQAYFTPK